MKKIIFTLLLAIVSSVWTTSMALCLGYTNGVYDAMGASTMHTGTIEVIAFPCEGDNDEPCPPCLTLALKQASDGQIYYLTTAEYRSNIQEQLDSIMHIAESANNSYKQWITVVGRVFWRDHNACIDVERIQTNNISSLCDEWNVLQFRSHMGYSPDEYYTQHYRLTSDTVINGQIFRKLYKENSYSGAMREGTNRDIYYVPSDSTHEYLLYAFNAQVGDTLSNLWVEGYQQEVFNERYADGWTMIVREIQETTPRTYILSYTCEGCSYPYYNKAIVWLEGVGYPAGPIGSDIPFDFEIFMPQLLCAYKNGEQVYVSNMGEQYGCEYNYNPDSTPSDTIPLYIKDGPGSSTIEPVDPNEIIAKLIHDELQMKEYLHTIIDYNLTKAPAANSSPAVKHVNPVVAADSFTDSETVTLTESGRYFLEMSHPDWDYTIVGTFVYNALQGLETIENSQSACTKELREGQLLIRQGEQLYTPTGIRIQ